MPQKKHRNFRIEDRVWFAYARICELERLRTSDALRRHLAAEVKRKYKLIADDPKWLAKLAEIEAEEAADE